MKYTSNIVFTKLILLMTAKYAPSRTIVEITGMLNADLSVKSVFSVF